MGKDKKAPPKSTQHSSSEFATPELARTLSRVLLHSHCMAKAWSLLLPSPAPQNPSGIQQQLREPRTREGRPDGSRETKPEVSSLQHPGKPRGMSLLVITARIPWQPSANKGPTDVLFIKCFILLQTWSIISSKCLQGRR